MPAPRSLVTPEGALTPLAIAVLATMSHVPIHLLAQARVRPASANWLRAPWYRPAKGGGAITVGRTIYFNRNWFAEHGPAARGDGTVQGTWRWLRHLAHEVGHLPQAERHGLHLIGKSAYIGAFTGQYLWRALTLRGQVHDGASLEREADRGRWVLDHLVGPAPLLHPLVLAVHRGDEHAVAHWCREQADAIAETHAAYPD